MPAGTLITIDREGNTDYVERIKEGAIIYSPYFGGLVTVESARAGPETGFLLEFTLSDGLKANVTAGHAMLVRALPSNDFNNVAARDVKIGDIMTTVNGKQTVVQIREIPVEVVTVYNFKISLPTFEDVLSRVVIVNGIHMLDLRAQELLAPWWQQAAAYLISYFV